MSLHISPGVISHRSARGDVEAREVGGEIAVRCYPGRTWAYLTPDQAFDFGLALQHMADDARYAPGN